MGVNQPLPEELKKVKLFESSFQKYTPTHLSRCASVAMQVAHLEYSKNTPISFLDFQTTYLSSMQGFIEFQKILLKVSTTLPVKLNIEDVKQFQLQA